MTTKNKPPSTAQPARTAAGEMPARQDGGSLPAASTASDQEIADFVAKMKTLAPVAAGRGRLVFAMDATMSREPTWDLALKLQADMFQAVKEVGGLDVQLVYFRGSGECRASKWVSDPEALARLMATVRCHGGLTQLAKVLSHAKSETESKRIHALVFVGDAMEENIDLVAQRAGELGLLGVPVFLFQEGHNGDASRAFREIARLTKGATCRFDQGSARQLRELLMAVAVYAAGGQKALLALAQSGWNEGARLLLSELKGKR